MVQSGTVFLAELRRRARADRRLHLVETCAVAALAGGLANIRIDDWGTLSFGGLKSGLLMAVLAAAIWGVAGSLLYQWLQTMYSRYITSLLLETGLLYLVLEHDPHDALAPLRYREILSRLKLNPQAGLSFRGRMLVFLRTYSACAGALGFHAFPAHLRLLGRICDYLLFLLVAIFAWQVYTNVLSVLATRAVISLSLKTTAAILLVVILGRATLGMARRTGLWHALVDALLGPDDGGGRAVMARW